MNVNLKIFNQFSGDFLKKMEPSPSEATVKIWKKASKLDKNVGTFLTETEHSETMYS